MISHQGVERRDVADVLRRRWPSVVVKELAQEEPAWAMSADDAADLGARRRGGRAAEDHGDAAEGSARDHRGCSYDRTDARRGVISLTRGDRQSRC